MMSFFVSRPIKFFAGFCAISALGLVPAFSENATASKMPVDPSMLKPQTAGSYLLTSPTLALQCSTSITTSNVLKVVAVLASNEDGSRAMGERVSGQLVPRAPYLRAPDGGPNLVSTNYAGDYIKQWMRVTNKILENSGADFRLDDDDVVYVEEKSNLLNGRSDDQAADEFFKAKRKVSSPDNPYRNRMIMLFAWGTGPTPWGGGASDVKSSFIAMPGVVDGGTRRDNTPVPGWYMMAHEMGHHLGLQHTFNDGPRALLEAVSLGQAVTKVTIHSDGSADVEYGSAATDAKGYAPRSISQQTRDNVVKYMNAWPYAQDPDQFDIIRDPGKKLVAKGVQDTPIDLGAGLAAYFGKSACEPVSGVDIGNLKGIDNAVSRLNPMSYNICSPENMFYTAGQMSVIKDTMKQPERSIFVAKKTLSVRTCKPPQFVVGPVRVNPGDPVEVVGDPATKIKTLIREPMSHALGTLTGAKGIMPAH